MTTYKVKSVTVSRKPNEEEEDRWIAFIGFFKENNPHLKARVPFKVLEFKDVQKVRVHELRNISFYLEGNDLVINDLTEISIDHKDEILTLTGKQKLPE